MVLSRLRRWLFDRKHAHNDQQNQPAPEPASAPAQEEEYALGLAALKIPLSTFNGASEERREALLRIDRLLAAILTAYKQEFDGLSRDQLRVSLREIVDLCDAFIIEMKAASWLELKIDFNAQRAREVAWSSLMKILPLESPSEGCELVAIVDTETTGLHANDEPITAAILLVEIRMPKGALARVVESYQGKREPSVPISNGAKAVHGLSLDDVRGHSFDLPHMERLLRSASIVVAHNAKFDRRMLRHVLTDSDGLPWACSMLTLRKHWDERAGRRSLDAICNALGVDRRSPHNAMTDCEALLKALSAPSGKTARSKSFMALMLERPWCPDGG